VRDQIVYYLIAGYVTFSDKKYGQIDVMEHQQTRRVNQGGVLFSFS
jgi:hypothetical protein